MDRSALGKLIAVHGIAPAHQQMVLVVAAVSFLFFIAMMIAEYARGSFGYFLLASGFLIVFLFTIVGWWIQRRNVVEIYDRGVAIRRFVACWSDISTIERTSDGALMLTRHDHETVLIPRPVAALDTLESYITHRMGRLSSH